MFLRDSTIQQFFISTYSKLTYASSLLQIVTNLSHVVHQHNKELLHTVSLIEPISEIYIVIIMSSFYF